MLVISVKGEGAYKVACGSGRHNIIQPAVVSATGRILDPLITFTGKNFQNTWKGSNALPKTFSSFRKWLDDNQNINCVVPLVSTASYRKTNATVFVWQLMGISIVVIEKATREGVHIPKLMAHITDKLQYLQVTCLSPFKGCWEKSLNDFVSSFRASKTMPKSMLIGLL